MITIDKEQVSVKFAEKLNDAKIVIGSMDNKLTFYDYNGKRGEIAVGDIVTKEDHDEIPSVSLVFNTIESIEIVELHLKSIKRRIRHPYGIQPECA